MDGVAKLAFVGGAVLLLALAATGGLAAYLLGQGGPGSPTQAEVAAGGEAPAEPVGGQAVGVPVEWTPGQGSGSQGREGPWQDRYGRAAPMCGGIGGMAPGEAIHWLLENHDRYEWQLQVYEDEWRIEWLIKADDPEAAETLYRHVLQMECILESGGMPRAMDPVFQLEAELKPYIHTEVEMLDETTVRVVKTAENECAWEAIKLHAEVVKGFFERGYEEARRMHPVPDYVMEMCHEYMEDEDEHMHHDDSQQEMRGHGDGHGYPRMGRR